MVELKKYYDEKELINLTQDLVRIPSHKDVPGREKVVVDYLYKFCKDHDIEVELQPVDEERSNILAYVRGNGSGKTLMLNGHTDTVPPYNMTIDPYGAEIKDGFIWGEEVLPI